METSTINSFVKKDLLLKFTWVDYCLFAAMMLLSMAIGIYFGCFGNKQKTKTDYLLGGRTMQVIPVAMSLIASDTSGVSLLAVPAEIYKYGANYVWSCVAVIIVGLATSYIYLPVFHRLQLTSSYEYLKIRFDSRVRVFASLLFAVSVVLYNSIVIYTPALALQQSTGIDVHLAAPVVCAICIFYTTIGGLKAVVWTDTVQMIAVIMSTGLISILGVAAAGSIKNIIETSWNGQRLDIFKLSVDPTLRDGILAVTVGATASNFGMISVSQSTVQRYLALPSITAARKAIAIFVSGVVVVKLATASIGLIMYTRYANCDPISNGLVTHADQILPYYIMDIAGYIPGLSGLFIAGIFSASLSTLSASLNTLAATVYEDFIVPYIVFNMSETRINYILKFITIFMGAVCTALVILVEKMGGILPLANSFTAITAGPLVGLFTLGMVFPIANAEGALCGAISGLAFITWIVIGNQWCKTHEYCKDLLKPVSIDQCSDHVSILNSTQTSDGSLPFYLYRVSFWYHTLMGLITTIVIGLLVSYFTRHKYSPVRQDLLSPFVIKLYNVKKLPNPSVGETEALNVKTVNVRESKL